MGGLIIGVVGLIMAFVLFVLPVNKLFSKAKMAIAGLVAVLSGLIAVGGSVGYNDAGYCQHIRTIFGTETNTCSTGWYFEGWGNSTAWPHFITVANTNSPDAKGSSISPPYTVRLADNWTGEVSQSTRYGIPQDSEQFIKMARDFRSPERLITTTLKPAVTASIDSVANMFTMEEYYSGGARDQFKTEFSDAVIKGRARVKQVSLNQAGGVVPNRAAPNDLPGAQDTSEIGDTEVRRVVMEKITDASGNDIRTPHAYSQYGIVVSTAILEQIDPDDEYERQINDRKAAASRRVVAREQRLEQEEQRLLAIQQGETDIAKRQAAARTEQIERTTNAETEKQLALIEASRMKEEAAIAQETAAINLEKARIDAEAVTVAADAEAYAKQAILEADGALQQKLDAYVRTQEVWAEAAAQINVPTTVMAGGAGGGTEGSGVAVDLVNSFLGLTTVKTAQDLALDTNIR